MPSLTAACSSTSWVVAAMTHHCSLDFLTQISPDTVQLQPWPSAGEVPRKTFKICKSFRRTPPCLYVNLNVFLPMMPLQVMAIIR